MRIQLLLVSAMACGAGILTAAAADSNVALNKPVYLNGTGTYFTGGWATADYTGSAASIVNGVPVPE